MIEAKIRAWTEMSLLSGSDCIVVKRESVIFPNATITLRLAENLWQSSLANMFVYVGRKTKRTGWLACLIQTHQRHILKLRLIKQTSTLPFYLFNLNRQEFHGFVGGTGVSVMATWQQRHPNHFNWYFGISDNTPADVMLSFISWAEW